MPTHSGLNANQKGPKSTAKPTQVSTRDDLCKTRVVFVTVHFLLHTRREAQKNKFSV